MVVLTFNGLVFCGWELKEEIFAVVFFEVYVYPPYEI